jgi:hypothetical protein
MNIASESRHQRSAHLILFIAPQLSAAMAHHLNFQLPIRIPIYKYSFCEFNIPLNSLYRIHTMAMSSYLKAITTLKLFENWNLNEIIGVDGLGIIQGDWKSCE